MTSTSITVFIAAVLLATSSVVAQRDSLVLNNGDMIAGELKALDAGIVTMETDYSKNDFTIEWDGVKKIYAQRRFLVTLRSGARFKGSVHSTGGEYVILADDFTRDTMSTTLMDIVYLRGLDTDFWSRLRANIDVGFTVTKANNLKQFSSQSSIGYLVDQWELTLSFDGNQSTQDSVAGHQADRSGSRIRLFPARRLVRSSPR